MRREERPDVAAAERVDNVEMGEGRVGRRRGLTLVGAATAEPVEQTRTRPARAIELGERGCQPFRIARQQRPGPVRAVLSTPRYRELDDQRRDRREDDRDQGAEAAALTVIPAA